MGKTQPAPHILWEKNESESAQGAHGTCACRTDRQGHDLDAGLLGEARGQKCDL